MEFWCNVSSTSVISIKDMVRFLQQLGQVDQQKMTLVVIEEWEKSVIETKFYPFVCMSGFVMNSVMYFST
jgi:hypothetical protein